MSAYYNDIDPYCCKVLRKNIANGNLPGGYVDERDIRTVRASDLMGYQHIHLFAGIGAFSLGFKWAGYPDWLPTWTLGFPCTDISNAGKREGLEGKQSGLWYQATRLLNETDRHLRPRYILIENVSALLGRGLSRVLGDLTEAGYDCEWTCLRASDVGAPHRRERIFIVAYPGSTGTRMEEYRGSGQRGQSPSTQQPEILRQEYWEAGTEGVRAGSQDVAYPDCNGRGWTQRTDDRDVAGTAGKDTQGERYPQRVAAQCSGTDVADPNGTQWRQEFEGRDVSHGHDARRQETASGSRMDGQTTVANATKQGLPLGGYPGLTTSGTQARTGMESQSERCSELADPDRQGLAVGHGSASTRGSCATTARGDARAIESGICRIFTWTPQRLDGYRWPAGPGEPQHSWESPRVVTEKVPHRVQRLKALGNAVVPQCVEYVARCILASLESEGVA